MRFPSTREMGKALGHVLKSHRSKTDLHLLLARNVVIARESMRLGQRTGEPSSTTPIAEPQAGDVAIPSHDDSAVAVATPRSLQTSKEEKGSKESGQRGILHRLPFFSRKR